MCTCPCGSTLNAAPIVTEVDLVGAHNGGDTDIHTPHAYSPGALLGAWAHPAPIIHISTRNVSFSILIGQNSVAEWLSG